MISKSMPACAGRAGAGGTGGYGGPARRSAMPQLDHFHPPLHGPRRWEGFHHAWATVIAQHLNQQVLPPGYFAEPEISVGPELEVDIATLELSPSSRRGNGTTTAVWSPPSPAIAVKADF